MIPVIIESPFRGETKAEEARNIAYLEKCIRWCVLRELTPYASHKMLTGALNDDNPAERSDGIQAGLEMSRALLETNQDVKVIFFMDYGMGGGMSKALTYYEEHNLKHRLENECIGDLSA